ncbi:uncharacterized protein LOC107981811 [Nasonia vitripennis]|uniref:Uncharacterized protein n=1 Tax=Nasonia vitripennis TaxID=7425 RepID=A0A7M7IWC2_NASVI|nr:uncharacterized protein LOC107981811 [Nasonia vitripennis]
MSLDAIIDYSYFMKNRDRLLKLIQFLKDNLEVTDENVASREIQEKITRNGLGLRNTYSVSTMACLPQFFATSGRVQHFCTASLEMIAGHRDLALYIIHYLKNVPEVPEKYPFFKCSLVTANYTAAFSK